MNLNRIITYPVCPAAGLGNCCFMACILLIKQGLIGKIFNFGNIIVDTAGSGVGLDFIWVYVENPIQVKNQIEKCME